MSNAGGRMGLFFVDEVAELVAVAREAVDLALAEIPPMVGHAHAERWRAVLAKWPQKSEET